MPRPSVTYAAPAAIWRSSAGIEAPEPPRATSTPAGRSTAPAFTKTRMVSTHRLA